MLNHMALIGAFVSVIFMTACGGGSATSAPLSRADEGLWSSNVSDGNFTYVIQMVILGDGSFWGLYGANDNNGAFNFGEAFYGASNISSNSVFGSYIDLGNSGSYSGSVSAQSNLNLTFTPSLGIGISSINMSYDDNYLHSATLSVVAGNYVNQSIVRSPGNALLSPGPSGDQQSFPSDLSISGSNLTLKDQNENVILTGIVSPHGATSIFDVALTIVTANPFIDNIYPGEKLNGILFKTSTGIEKNNIEMIFAAGGAVSFYIGK